MDKEGEANGRMERKLTENLEVILSRVSSLRSEKGERCTPTPGCLLGSPGLFFSFATGMGSCWCLTTTNLQKQQGLLASLLSGTTMLVMASLKGRGFRSQTMRITRNLC